MKFNEIIKDLKSKKYNPIYFLHGEESYFIDEIANYIEKNVLTETEKSFNQTVLYGKEANYNAVVDTARRFPIMAERQVLIIKEAKEMRDLPKLERYVANPAPTTILVICHKHKKLDQRSKIAKVLKKNAVIFESKKLYDNQMADWINSYLRNHQYTIKPDATLLIVEYLGTDLSKVVNELDKLMLNIPKGTMISMEQVQKNIGISKDYNIFELQNALGKRDIVKTQRIVSYFIANARKNPLVQVISSLYGFFSKIYIFHSAGSISDNEMAKKLGTRTFFLKDYRIAAKNFNRAKTEKAINILREYDLKSKGVNRDSTPDTELLREMVFKILH
ncbi:MAG: DNA polymerase III subunit delta [Saprospiraceae bacterium]